MDGKYIVKMTEEDRDDTLKFFDLLSSRYYSRFEEDDNEHIQRLAALRVLLSRAAPDDPMDREISSLKAVIQGYERDIERLEAE